MISFQSVHVTCNVEMRIRDLDEHGACMHACGGLVTSFELSQGLRLPPIAH